MRQTIKRNNGGTFHSTDGKMWLVYSNISSLVPLMPSHNYFFPCNLKTTFISAAFCIIPSASVILVEEGELCIQGPPKETDHGEDSHPWTSLDYKERLHHKKKVVWPISSVMQQLLQMQQREESLMTPFNCRRPENLGTICQQVNCGCVEKVC